LGRIDTMSGSEAELLALTRADREVQNRRRDVQDLKDEEVTAEPPRKRNRKRDGEP
jgi:hypothetical protein